APACSACPSKSSARSYSCTRNWLLGPPSTSVLPYWATPGDSIAYTISKGSSTTTPSGTCRKAPPVQKAALAASSLCRSIGSRLEYQGATSSPCSRKASCSEHRITPCSRSCSLSSSSTTAP